MRSRILTIATALGLVLAASPIADAHHSFCSTYDSNRPFTFSGKVSKLDYRNPHVFLTLDVKDDKGVVKQWTLHAAPMGQLSAAGWKADTIKFGDEVLARGFLSKDRNEQFGALAELVFKGKTLWAGEARIC